MRLETGALGYLEASLTATGEENKVDRRYHSGIEQLQCLVEVVDLGKKGDNNCPFGCQRVPHIENRDDTYRIPR